MLVTKDNPSLFSSESHAKFMVPPLTILGKSNQEKKKLSIKQYHYAPVCGSSVTVMILCFSSSTPLPFHSLELMVYL